MACKILIEYAGAACHVMVRGNRGRGIYGDDRDRKLWLETLGEACEKTGWRIHAWVMTIPINGGEIEGLIFHCTPLCDMHLEAVEWSKRWIARHADDVVGK
jgi:hypothetical protein